MTAQFIKYLFNLIKIIYQNLMKSIKIGNSEKTKSVKKLLINRRGNNEKASQNCRIQRITSCVTIGSPKCITETKGYDRNHKQSSYLTQQFENKFKLQASGMQNRVNQIKPRNISLQFSQCFEKSKFLNKQQSPKNEWNNYNKLKIRQQNMGKNNQNIKLSVLSQQCQYFNQQNCLNIISKLQLERQASKTSMIQKLQQIVQKQDDILEQRISYELRTQMYEEIIKKLKKQQSLRQKNQQLISSMVLSQYSKKSSNLQTEEDNSKQ